MAEIATDLQSFPLVRLTQIYFQQPLNSPENLMTPYCPNEVRHQICVASTTANGKTPKAPRLTSPPFITQIIPPGSCVDHADGGIPSGQQLLALLGGKDEVLKGKPGPNPPQCPSVNDDDDDDDEGEWEEE